ncbi:MULTISPECIES: IniB N-terminal domain-containing protein [unclassified Pseudonocardia]|uniref:IniB N-terminal domain-containing protein n=1 Tax=unclassified Pseudonocardia TaxID=2619320 RepID=UPI000A41A3BD|nr:MULTISPECIES: IniB N-terminal domain-containing protein [unclassified Pseudonocardia]MBN9097998.1 IniB N-terminal domain-containing protein [Pseudonocardia sp.]
MAESMSLMEFIQKLFTDGDLRALFNSDPQAVMSDYGLSSLSPDDVCDALVLAQDNQTADFSRDYNTGGNHIQLPPAPPAPRPEPGESEHEAAVRYLNTYVTNNYVDDRDTIVDNSVNQQIDTGGGDFDQDIDIDSVVASGDGAVAAGGDIEDSTITTGDDNQVGDGNVKGDGNVVGDDNQAVTGDGNTTSFGDGDATSTKVGGDVNVGDGGAFASGGSASVDNSDNSLNDVGNTWTDNSTNDSFNDSSDNSVHDSGNTAVDASVHDSGNDNSETTVDTSFTDESDNSVVNDNSLDNVGNIHV